MDALLFTPEIQTKKIIIHVHGKEGHYMQNHCVTSMISAYPQIGYAFLTFNYRGHDSIADILIKKDKKLTWGQGGAAFETIEESIHDISGVIDFVQSLGYTEIILQGHSLGPHKICYYFSQTHDVRISKVILLATSDIYNLLNLKVPDWKEARLAAKKLIDAKSEMELMPVHLWSNSPFSARTVWSYTRPDSHAFVFNFSDPTREFIHFNQIKLPILVVNAQDDIAIGCAAEVYTKLLQQNTTSSRISVKTIDDTTHGFMGKEDILVKSICDWVQKAQ